MSSKKRVVTLALLQESSIDAISHDGTRRKTESSGREGQAKNTLQTSSEVIGDQSVYETGSRNGSTVSEGVGLVKPRGLSAWPFPQGRDRFSQQASCKLRQDV